VSSGGNAPDRRCRFLNSVATEPPRDRSSRGYARNTLTIFYGLIARAGPARATLAFYLSPGVTVVLGWLLLNEQVSSSTVLGMVAIVGGSALAANRVQVEG
jgi:hypothetical protein